MYGEPAFPLGNVCLAIVTICVVFITAYLVSVLKRLNKILSHIEAVTDRSKHVLRFVDTTVAAIGRVTAFFQRKRKKTDKMED